MLRAGGVPGVIVGELCGEPVEKRHEVEPS
jgi:hypothetical protein